MSEFDFDTWMRLARDDPEAFERRRREEIQAIISRAPEHTREKLTRLQWRIDAERARCKTPFQSALRLNQMLLDSYLGEHGLAAAIFELDTMFNGATHDFSPIPLPKRDADVLAFHPKKTAD